MEAAKFEEVLRKLVGIESANHSISPVATRRCRPHALAIGTISTSRDHVAHRTEL